MPGIGIARRTALGFVAVLLVAAAASAESVNRRQGLALDGYDPVAYFTEGRAVRGDSAIVFTHEGATYRFASAAHREAFAKEPGRYVPQFGGFCAWAVSRGYTAPIDPEAWRVVDGKLYLNYSRSVQKMWESDIPGNIRKADGNWPGLRAK